jgi:hypothetical protein
LTYASPPGPDSMRPFTAVLAVVLASAVPVAADIVGGGGSATTDCLLVFDAAVNSPPTRPHDIRCTDGAPCDADGTVNGSCQFAVAVCANSTVEPRCTLNGVGSVTVDHALDNGDRRFDPEFQALQTRIGSTIDPPTTQSDRCTAATNFHVPVTLSGGVCRKSRKTVRIVTISTPIGGRLFKDKDKLKLTCDPAPAGCNPTFSGTFDRIQNQIFNQSCALSGCHDSQTQQAGMILEVGASYGNIVDVPATTPNVPADWRRVLPGDSSRSFLFHKVTGDLDAGQGARMPFASPPLDQHLIDIIQLWIDAGAPDTGWVPGTEQ